MPSHMLSASCHVFILNLRILGLSKIRYLKISSPAPHCALPLARTLVTVLAKFCRPRPPSSTKSDRPNTTPDPETAFFIIFWAFWTWTSYVWQSDFVSWLSMEPMWQALPCDLAKQLRFKLPFIWNWLAWNEYTSLPLRSIHVLQKSIEVILVRISLTVIPKQDPR